MKARQQMTQVRSVHDQPAAVRTQMGMTRGQIKIRVLRHHFDPSRRMLSGTLVETQY